MAKVECSNCGTKYDEYWMVKLNPGTGVQYLCWDCYKQGQREASLSDIQRQRKLYRLAESKKVKRWRTYDNPSNTNAYEIALRARWNKRYRDTIVAEGYADRQRQETLRRVPKIEPHL